MDGFLEKKMFTVMALVLIIKLYVMAVMNEERVQPPRTISFIGLTTVTTNNNHSVFK